MLTQKELKEKLYYDRDFGTFHWLKSSGGVVVGSLAGSWSPTTHHWSVVIRGKRYLRSRLIFFYENGKWPKETIDHKNRIAWDDRPCNLTEATLQEQMHNQNLFSTNTSGTKGVWFDKRAMRWVAEIYFSKKRPLGQFRCKLEAIAHRLAAEQCLGWVL